MYRAIPDPPVPKNGKCATCGNARPELAAVQKDPFCSTHCARIWHEANNPKYPKGM